MVSGIKAPGDIWTADTPLKLIEIRIRPSPTPAAAEMRTVDSGCTGVILRRPSSPGAAVAAGTATDPEELQHNDAEM